MNKTVIAITRFAAAALLAVAVSGCEAEKSRNPLSPNVAGPIAGVSISPPTPVNPVNAEVLNTGPVRLVFNNASTNGERPLFYVVELATDNAFANKVFAQSKVTPGTGTTTSIVVDASLTAERTYFWRAKADDGANESAYSTVAKFDIVVPVVIEPPVPVSPVSGLVASSTAPALVVNNAGVQGRAGRVDYWFEVALDQGFARTIIGMAVERSGGTTTTAQMPELPGSTLLFWRVVGIGVNGTVAGTWSLTQSFRTPASAPAPSPSPSPSPTPAPPAGGRTPDPPVGGKLPLPNMASVVQQVAAQNPGALQNSCQDHGGNWQFMDLLLNELRRYDSRWGYNGKRGNSNDPSKDAIAYHWSRGADEGSTDVYIIDVIGSHCGSPYPAWIDQTEITLSSGTIGRWTGRGRF